MIIVDGLGKSKRPKPYNIVDGGIPEVFNTWEQLADAKLRANVLGDERTADGASPAGRKGDIETGVPEQTGRTPGPVADNDEGSRRKRLGKRIGGDRDSSKSGRTVEQSAQDDADAGISVEASSSDQPNRLGRRSEQRTDTTGRKRPESDSRSERVDDLDALIEAEFDAQLADQKSESEPKIETKLVKKRLGKKPSPQTNISKAADTARKAADDLWSGFKKQAKNRLNSGLDADLAKLAVRVALAEIKADTLTFAAFVERTVQQVPAEMLDKIKPYMEKAWEVAHRRGMVSDPAGKFDDVLKPKIEDKLDEKLDDTLSAEGDEFQVAYKPGSKNESVGSLLPKNHANAVQRGLDAIRDKHGDLDDFVAKELGFTPKQMQDAFSAEQVDALAMAIAGYKRGRAFIIGDQTGVGKGRAAAAMILFAQRQGLIPIFVTQKPTLYADMVRDLIDIGVSTPDKPFKRVAYKYTGW